MIIYVSPPKVYKVHFMLNVKLIVHQLWNCKIYVTKNLRHTLYMPNYYFTWLMKYLNYCKYLT